MLTVLSLPKLLSTFIISFIGSFKFSYNSNPASVNIKPLLLLLNNGIPIISSKFFMCFVTAGWDIFNFSLALVTFNSFATTTNILYNSKFTIINHPYLYIILKL